MKIPFRTTLEKELIESLKINAIERGRNVNDILEPLIKEYLEKDRLDQARRDFLYVSDPLTFLTTGALESVEAFLDKYDLKMERYAKNILEECTRAIFKESGFEKEKKQNIRPLS